jgi:hypothetical protein
MHRTSNLNKFKDFEQVLKKIPKLCLMKKKGSKIHKERLNKFFCFKISITNTITINVFKMFKCDKNQVPYCNVQNFKK